MKILYGEGNFLDKGHQILAYPASVGNEMNMGIEQQVAATVPEAKQSVHNMFAETDYYTVVPPMLGDVIWTETSGRKWYAHCIVYDENGEFSYPAFELCVKSLKKKAIELQHDEIGIPLRWVDTAKWQRICDILEDELTAFQVFAYDPENEVLLNVVDNLPGPKKAFYADVQIRFKDL